MISLRQRQLLLSLITLAAVAATVLVATAGKPVARVEQWVGSWAMAPAPAGAGRSKAGFVDQTIRMVVHTSVAGTQARIRLSNRFGTMPLTVGHATLALPWIDGGPGDLRPGSIQDVMFGGQRSVTIPVGGQAISDTIAMAVAAESDVAVSIYLPEPTGPATWHLFARQTTYIGAGDHTAAATGADLPDTTNSWFFLTGVDVLNDSGQGSVAVVGDSLTDGFAVPVNTNQRWTDRLAARLNREAPGGRAPGVLNLGMAGNRFGHNGADAGLPELGVNASARFYPDALAQAGVHTVILQLGINDVWLGRENANTIIAEMQQLAGLAHESGLRILVCTLMPWNGFAARPGAVTYTPTLDSVRLAVNAYIRTNSDFDGVIDLDKAMRDPANPTKLRPAWDSGDHIHPNVAGNEAMANAVPLQVLLDAGSVTNRRAAMVS